MLVIFSKLAGQELDDAGRFYEIEFQGLGKRFREEVLDGTSFAQKARLLD